MLIHKYALYIPHPHQAVYVTVYIHIIYTSICTHILLLPQYAQISAATFMGISSI